MRYPREKCRLAVEISRRLDNRFTGAFLIFWGRTSVTAPLNEVSFRCTN